MQGTNEASPFGKVLMDTSQNALLISGANQLAKGMERNHNEVKSLVECKITNIHLIHLGRKAFSCKLLAQDRKHLRGIIHTGQVDTRFHQGKRDASCPCH